ncbi:unnamed protein product [Brassicogethes aeneus]|uniref:Uncharacterized protein n=1 Tax=Brassicogethes aeneus TaxID=1431903 RepID=A0A9P0FAG3_BRAAE|nr:unnamed protein product [Brassicogethes aeneus]
MSVLFSTIQTVRQSKFNCNAIINRIYCLGVDQALYFWIDTTRLRMVISEKLDSETSARIRDIRPVPNSFAIIGSTENVTEIFRTAIKEDLIKLPERWNLVLTDFRSQEFDRSLLNGQPINVLSFDEQFCCSLMNQNTCNCPDDIKIPERFFGNFADFLLKVFDQYSSKGNTFDTYQCNSTSTSGKGLKYFNDVFNGVLDNERSIYKDGDTVRAKLIGNIERGIADGGQNYEAIATVKENMLTTIVGKTITSVKRYYRVGITHAIPWSYKEKDPKTGQMYWTGYCADFTQKLSELMDFDYDFVEPKNGTFGSKIDGLWDGVIGDLVTGETDLAITAMIMTASREEVVDFVAPYFEQTGISIVIRKPVRKTSLFKFMTVLKLEVWLSIVGALISTGFMVWFLDKYSPYSARNNKKAYPYPCREFTLKESFWFALTSFTPQGGGEAPKALSGRTLVAAYWLFVVLMLATFTANLAAFLTVERMQAPVQSLEQLARQSRINYTVVQDSLTHEYFINMKHAEDTIYRMWKELTLNTSTDDKRYRVWDYPIREQYGQILLAINDSNPVANASEGFRIVDEHLNADFAFIHDSSEIKYEITRNCNLTEVGEIFGEKPYAIAIQQGSHLNDEISKMMLSLQTDRFFEKLQAKYWNHSSKGDCATTDDNEGITLESLGGVFIATLFGLGLAMVTLAGEVIYYRNKRKTIEKEKALKASEVFTVKKANMEKFPQTITIGSTFKPINKIPDGDLIKMSHITLYPRARNRITQVQQ